MTNEGPPPEDTATHQPTLPALELPEYHGVKPIGMRTSVNGTGNRLTAPHGIDDRAVLVLEVRCKKAGHESTDDGLVYHETHKVVDMFELDRDAGVRLLRHLRSTYRTAADEARGVEPLDGLGDTGYTDASGVALLPEEVAELRGDTVMRILGDTAGTPVVVITEDGERRLWPDEYERNRPRPEVGELCDGQRVTELLHHATGEPVATTDEALAYFGAGSGQGGEVPTVDVSWEGQPGDHRPVDDGGYGDVPAYDAPASTEPPAPPLPGEAELERYLPTSADFAFVNRPVPALRTGLGDVDDVDHLRRLLEAEKQGRGEGHKARRGALDAIHSRLAELGAPQ